jgi:hypothetical protein
MSLASLSSLMVTLPITIIPGKLSRKVRQGMQYAYGCRYFVGGTVLQRPGLASIGNTVVAGFGGHCDNFNYTGMLVAVSKTTGVGVTNVIAMEAQPGTYEPVIRTLQGDYTNDSQVHRRHKLLTLRLKTVGKPVFGNLVWESLLIPLTIEFSSLLGMLTNIHDIISLTIFSNGRGAGDNGGKIPASGKKPISTLEEVVADFGVNPSTGVLTQADYFEPFEYDNLNGGDLDFGSSGVALLDPSTFFGTGVSRIAVAGGKSGKIYILNADNLGGYAQGL